METLRTICDVVHGFRRAPPRNIAFGYFTGGELHTLSSQNFIDAVQGIALGLVSLGLKPGDRVALFAPSSPYWTIADLAIAIAGGVTVPLFSNLSDEHLLYEIGQCKPRFLFVGDDKNWERMGSHAHLFEQVISLEAGVPEAAAIEFCALLEKGESLARLKPTLLQEIEEKIKPDDLATILYTSGSTGLPKGVELSHKNLISIIPCDTFGWKPESDRYLSFLPLPHIFAKQLNLIMVAWGIQTYYLNDLTQIGDVCKEIQPTVMIVVPRLLEKVYSKMRTKVNETTGIKGVIGRWAFGLATGKETCFTKLLRPIASKLVYGPMRNALGGKFRLIISGGAPLNPQLHHFFRQIGLPVVQGWGLTEGSTIAVNRIETSKIGTVGPPLPGTTFSISPEGEVLAKGDTLMRGYYMDKEATAKAIDKKGWLHTGDRGFLDQDGHLIIEGRINESFKTAQGEFVHPVPIEQQFAYCPFIETAMVIGEGRPFASILLFPDKKALQPLKVLYHMSALSDEEFLRSSQVGAEIEKLIHQVNSHLDHSQQIHEYLFILDPPTIEGGELTPTMKLRRKEVLKKYARLIDKIYHTEKETV